MKTKKRKLAWSRQSLELIAWIEGFLGVDLQPVVDADQLCLFIRDYNAEDPDEIIDFLAFDTVEKADERIRFLRSLLFNSRERNQYRGR